MPKRLYILGFKVKDYLKFKISNKLSNWLASQPKSISNIFKVLPLLLTITTPILSIYVIPSSIVNRDLKEYVESIFKSDMVQNNGFTLTTRSLSRKDSSILKMHILETLDKKNKDIIILSNHQLQFITKNLSKKSIFNMWMGNFGITEIADIVAYMDKNVPETFPNKVLITGITSPNNDKGGSIVGYQNELPDNYVSASSNPYIFTKSQLFAPGEMISNSYFLRRLKYTFDYKFLWGYLKTFMNRNALKENNISLVKDKFISGDFAFDKTGSADGYSGVYKGLNFNEKETTGRPLISEANIPEIVYSLKFIDKIAEKRGLKHVLIIPPVYESLNKERMTSSSNIILDKALKKFNQISKATYVIDHRRDARFLGRDKEIFYYHFDHPSPKYGEVIFNEIKKLL